jgi:hypothetical protein
MGSAVEIYIYPGWGDLDSGGDVDQVTENLACLGIGVAPHAVGEAPIESACHHEERGICW